MKIPKTPKVPKKPKKTRLTRLEWQCERWWLSDCLQKYRGKIQGKSKAMNITLEVLAWEVFSDYLLLSKSTKGMCKCVTCVSVKHRDSPDMHPWHYRKQGDSAFLKYELSNVRPQCKRCNVMLQGNLRNYYRFMIETVWEEREKALRESKQHSTRTISDLVDMVIEWRNWLKKNPLYK